MPRRLSNPVVGDYTNFKRPIVLGGTGADTAEAAKIALGGIDASSIGQPLGPCPLNINGLVDPEFIPIGAGTMFSLNGDRTAHVGQNNTYLITDYDIAVVYDLVAVSGTVSRNEDVITYTPPISAGAGGFYLNGELYSIPVVVGSVTKPTITAPTNGATNQLKSLTITSSAFAFTGGGSETHLNSSWQMATDANFTDIVEASMDDVTNKTSWPVTGLVGGETYYVRVEHKGNLYGESGWGTVSSFTASTANIPSAEQALLSSSDNSASAKFGYSVALSYDGLTAVVGAYDQISDSYTSAGRAYVFTSTNGAWAQQQVLKASDQAANYDFGYLVAISGDGEVIVIRNNKGTTNLDGSYIFTKIAGVWTQYQKINSAVDGKAIAITMDGSTFAVVIGATICVYRKGATDWVLEATITPTLTNGMGGKHALAISDDGDTLLVGCYGATVTYTNAGTCYVYKRTYATWALQQQLSASDKATNGYFGYSVALSGNGDIAIMGCNTTKKVYLFTRSGSTWTQQTIITSASYDCEALAISKDGTIMALTNAAAGSVNVYTVSGYALKATLVNGLGVSAQIDQVALSYTGAKLIFGISTSSSTGKASVFA